MVRGRLGDEFGDDLQKMTEVPAVAVGDFSRRQEKNPRRQIQKTEAVIFAGPDC